MRNEHGEVEWRRDERDPEMKLWQYVSSLEESAFGLSFPKSHPLHAMASGKANTVPF